MEDKSKKYIKDTIFIILEEIKKIKEGNDFDNGRKIAYYEVLDLFKSQALAFDISLKDIGLNDTNLDKLLGSHK